MLSSGPGFLKTFQTLALIVTGSAVIAAPALAQPLPAGGHAGCYAKMAFPAAYKTVTERVTGAPMVSYRDIPAVIQHYSKQVLVAPAHTEHEVIAPVYKTTWRWVETPAPVRHISTPAVFRTVTERRLISPAHLVWRPGSATQGFVQSHEYGQGGYSQQARPTGEVLCRVLIPARYGVSRHRILVSPSRQITVQGPPHRTHIQDRVLVSPGRTIDHAIPAVYRAVDATRVTRPASREQIVTPGSVRMVSHTVLAHPAHFGWAPIACKAPPAHHDRQRAYVKRAPIPAPAPMPAPPPQTCGCRQPGVFYGPNYPTGQSLAPTANPSQAYPPTVPSTGGWQPYDVGHPANR